MDKLLVARGLHKSYGIGSKRLNVIKGIDLEVNRGTTLFIVGPSGAGKSTLLHLLAGLDRPDTGEVMLGGSSLYELPDRRLSELRNKKIGFVFQFYHLLQEFSAVENVMLPGLIRRDFDTTVLRKKAEAILARVGLASRMDNRPSELSGGEQQRVAIARALINSPEILFCDEPTGNLDSENGRLVDELIFDLAGNEGLAVVVVTHQKEYIDGTARYLIIKDGILESCMV